MFENIGGKLKVAAKVITVIGIAFFSLMFLLSLPAAFDAHGDGIALLFGALITWVVGCLASWVGSFVMYGIGEVIDNTAGCLKLLYEIKHVAENSKPDASNTQAPKAIDYGSMPAWKRVQMENEQNSQTQQ